jgi:hypothetical protein
MTGNADVAVLHHHTWEFAEDFDQFVKHAMPQHEMPPRRVASARKGSNKT